MADQLESHGVAPTRTPALYPRLVYREPAAALEHLVEVFGLRERREERKELGEGRFLAWLEFGDGVVMIGGVEHEIHGLYSPAEVGQATAMINLDVPDVDSHYRRAVAAGASITMEIEDSDFGRRRYEAVDLEGHRWHFSESLAAIGTYEDRG